MTGAFIKTFILVFHPDMSTSRTNRPLATKAEALGDGVTMRYMYDPYPDQKVDVAVEQIVLETVDRVVLQFPMHWYSTPTLLKQWFDDVLLHDWTYGSAGKALVGKELLVTVSTGGPGDTYSHESSYGHALTELLWPLQTTASMVQMTYLAPFTTTRVLTIAGEALTQRAEDCAATLRSTDLPVLDLRG